MKAWLALGSNLEDPFLQLKRALAYIKEKCYVTVLKESAIIQTKPVGYLEQPDFANQIIEVETKLNPIELLAFAKATEEVLGRTPTFTNGPRIIDIDILFYEDQVVSTSELCIPHPAIPERGFLLQLLSETAPDMQHPLLGKTMQELYEIWLREGGVA